MRQEILVVILVLLVVGSLGVGYLAGVGNQHITTVTTTNSGSQEPNPNYPYSTASSCSVSQSSCLITVTEIGYSGQIGGFGSVQWSCQKNVPPGGQTCQGAYLSCKPANIVSGGTAIINCDAQTSYALPAAGTPFSGYLDAGTAPGTLYYVPFVGNFTQ
jgi:hypothetical protein